MCKSRAQADLAFISCCLFISAAWSAAHGQDLLNDSIDASNFRLELRPYVTMPSNRNDIISMTTRPGDARPYITTQEGYVFVLNANANGTASAVQFFNFASALSTAGRAMSGSSGQQGLQSVAFHPDFNRIGQAGYGKLYTSYLENRPANTAGLNFLGNSASGVGVNADGVLSEWTFNFETQQVDPGSFRELFRVRMPVYDHPIKQARFNPHAVPGDEDYGLLYLTHGDSNVKHSPNDDPLDLDNALGKMLRIDPLQSGADRYTIPGSNPFADSGDPSVLKEIYAYGFRNPHTYSFNQDDDGRAHILAGDIGRNNIEEVNLVLPGGNYGWTEREGTFIHLQLPDSDPGAGYITGVAPLPLDEATLGLTYPVAQYDHDSALSEISSGNAIATGHVIRNGSDPALNNQLIFTDFSRRTVNNSYHTDFGEMLAAVTQLDADESSRDEPNELTQAAVHSLPLALDHDNNPATPMQFYDDFLTLLQGTTSPSTSRTDIRLGEGAFGEMYVTSKVNGRIYLVTNSVPVPGDFDADGAVTGRDFLIWQRELGDTGGQSPADANRDDVVDAADLAIWQEHFGQAYGEGQVAASAVPEPATMYQFALAILALATAGWRSRGRNGASRSSLTARATKLGSSMFVVAAVSTALIGCGTSNLNRIEQGAKDVDRHAQDIQDEASPK